MTAFITHYLKSKRLDLIGLLALLCLFVGHLGSVHAEPAMAEVTALRMERSSDAVLLSSTVKFELPSAVEDALLKGVAVIFVAEADIFRDRWYWMKKKVASAERHMRLAYQPLTRRWRLSQSSGLNNSSGLGVALNQNFDTLADALAAVQRQSRWKVAEISDVDPEQRHVIEFRFRLDVAQLPRPLQIGTLGQSDWDIAVSTTRPLVMESAK
jgi:hypothetical protein